MKNKTNFTIEKEGVCGEYLGNNSSGKIIIFSHGFGVKRDSRGLYTQLIEKLKDQFLVVMFDYGEVDNNGNTHTCSFSSQSKKLQAVIEFVKEKFKITELDIIAHSQGCVVAAQVNPDGIEKTLFLAAPVSPVKSRMIEYFSQRKGTEINQMGVSKIKRSDGSYTFIPKEFWPEAEIFDPLEKYMKLANRTELYFIKPREDQVIVGESYREIKDNPKIHFIEISGNHDFEGNARIALLEIILDVLTPGTG